MANTRVLFDLTPAHAPARTLVVTAVTAALLSALAPVGVGLVLDAHLTQSADRLGVYRTFFTLAAVVQAGSFWPLRGFRTNVR